MKKFIALVLLIVLCMTNFCSCGLLLLGMMASNDSEEKVVPGQQQGNNTATENALVTLDPATPVTVHEYDYSGSKTSSIKITEVTYSVRGSSIYFYVTGEKTYDKNGSGHSSTTWVRWKLYDSDGYTVADGTFLSPSLSVGEKFKNEEIYAWDVIEEGKTYKLVLSDYDY